MLFLLRTGLFRGCAIAPTKFSAVFNTNLVSVSNVITYLISKLDPLNVLA